MATDLNDIARRVRDADWDVLHPQLVDYADFTLRSSIGWDKGAVGNGRPCIEGRDAHSFLDEAVDKTLNGTRKWDPEKIDLWRHLSEAIRSLIYSHLNSRMVRARQHLRAAEAGAPDPIDCQPDCAATPDDVIADAETMKLRNDHMLSFKDSLKDDAELIALFDAYDAEITDPRDIALVTSLRAERISELKRKLLAKYHKFTDKYAGPLCKTDLLRERR